VRTRTELDHGTTRSRQFISLNAKAGSNWTRDGLRQDFGRIQILTYALEHHPPVKDAILEDRVATRIHCAWQAFYQSRHPLFREDLGPVPSSRWSFGLRLRYVFSFLPGGVLRRMKSLKPAGPRP
jgi:hypothetical protein